MNDAERAAEKIRLDQAAADLSKRLKEADDQRKVDAANQFAADLARRLGSG
jgi:hypothetical protein